MLTQRGLRTLPVRLRQHDENAHAVAEFLRDRVEAVYWPGLGTHPGYDVAQRQQDSPGAMLSFECPGGRAGVEALFNGSQMFSLAVSLGGVESLWCHPATMTHAGMTDEARAIAGISPALVRLSIGIEDAGDLVADLDAGIARAEAAS
ncbi:Cystathionine gamma-synthase [Platysternon megacephalum]|uniref:Cystathionine gamma-synthase n=1 Tax=Platysternon megacephalum TaxID=55544 RepID=A0A4D9DID6_9SAUR|nr:Cystathionine gamma-synthase [Platysternon megacephalum]